MALPADSTPSKESVQNVDDPSFTPKLQLASPAPEGSNQHSSTSTSNQPTQSSPVRQGSPASSNTPGIAAPHPKRFSAVNINKKFLQKEPPAPGPSTASNPTTAKSNNLTSRSSAPQTATSRSRLFATKLTNTPSVPPPPPNGASWSRPSSTTPNSTASVPTQHTDKISALSGPFTSQNGKVIQPQPRSNPVVKDRQSNSSPVWGNRNTVQNSGPNIPSKADFPTAAEAVQEVTTKKLKRPNLPQNSSETSATQQARIDEADTFRGVHLDPNAHHWDEMEEDDDNFLDAVVEFGDGKQYKVTTIASTPTPPPQDVSDDRPPTPGNDEPVSKEERFGNDIGRHWPHGPPPIAPQRNLPTSPASSHVSLHSPQDSSRHLFNERSNRFEPYAGHQQRASPFAQRTDTHGDSDGRLGQKPTQFARQPSNRDESRRLSRQSDKTIPPHEHSMKLSNMGPPSLPPLHQSTKESLRQLPPHLSQPPMLHDQERRLSTESHRSQDGMMASSPQLGRDNTWLSPKRTNRIVSPTLSLTSNPPATPESLVEPIPTNVNLDEVRKGVMHTAAERAKQRRQQEEEEREAQRERARKKAIELEAKSVTTTAKATQEKETARVSATEVQVNDVIAEAIASVEPSKIATSQSSAIQSHELPSQRDSRHLSEMNSPRPFTARRPSSVMSDVKASEQLTPADQVNSWRSKVAPMRPPSLASNSPPVAKAEKGSARPAFSGTVFPQTDNILEQKPEENLEIVDYTELGRFVGVSEPEAVVGEDFTQVEKPIVWTRPVASDFFDDQPVDSDAHISSNDNWRKMSETTVTEQPRQFSAQTNGSTVQMPAHSLYPRSRGPSSSYKEATMSTLDDTMSRIRGALHNMHEPSNTNRPVASHIKRHLRHLSNDMEFDEEHREVFDVSATEPSRSPPPAWKSYVVSLGKSNNTLEPLSKRQLINAEQNDPLRLDVMTWDPPVEGMSKHDLSLNEVLFHKQPALKGKIKYRVLLPQPKPMMPPLIGPRVNLPSAFGKPREAIESLNWRKPAVTREESPLVTEATTTLATTSRSPPPDTLRPQKDPTSLSLHAVSNSSVAAASPSISLVASSVPKANVDLGTSKSSSIAIHSALLNDKSQPSSPFSATSAKVESTSSDESADRPITPPQRHTATWAKSPLAFTTIESPVKGQGPDADHIKAVWLQTPEKPHVPVLNSLEGIADDLTAIPFTIQEVKSEDGETPPPQPAARVNFDMKRAFQQVPMGSESSNSLSTSRPLQPVPTPLALHPRYPSYGYQIPPPSASPSAHPAYAAYPPAMPPSSPAMYPPHPGHMHMRVPMNGQSHYPPPVWMVQGPHMGSPGGVMRPLPSPYMMPYTPGTPIYAMPPPSMQQNGPIPMNNTVPGRGMPPPSPITTQQNAHPIGYAGGPIQRQPSGGYAAAPSPVTRGRTPSGQSTFSNSGFINSNTWRS